MKVGALLTQRKFRVYDAICTDDLMKMVLLCDATTIRLQIFFVQSRFCLYVSLLLSLVSVLRAVETLNSV